MAKYSPSDHDVSFALSGNEFLDNYSRLDATPVTVVRRADGALVHEVQRADASRLFATGWKYPTPIFDLLVPPNRNHGFGSEPYVTRRT